MADAGDVAIQGADTAANHDRIAPAARAVAAQEALLVVELNPARDPAGTSEILDPAL